MAIDNRYYKHFPVSCEILECYDLLASLLILESNKSSELIELINRLKEIVKFEFDKYNTLTTDDIHRYKFELNNTPLNWRDLEDLRIDFRLSCTFDRLMNNSIKLMDLFPMIDIDMDLSFSDIVNSKIIIDIYKLINKKISLLKFNDNKSIEYTNKLRDLNIQNALFKLSMHELSEILFFDSLFDIDKIKDINLDQVSSILSVFRGRNIDIIDSMQNKICLDVLNILNNIVNINFNADNVILIYDNLFVVSQLEILLGYLNKSQLEVILAYCNRIKYNDKLIENNIKSLVRYRYEEYK